MMKIKEPVSALSHLFGAALSVAGLVILVVLAALRASIWHVVSFSIFGASLILLYTASGVYHSLPLQERGTRILRKIDHMMIYVLIAGTYTPICLIPLKGVWGWSLLASIWTIAFAGMIMKGFWINAPRWLSTASYIMMGWLVVVAFLPLIRAIPIAAFSWLLAGGVLYSIGGLIYGLKWPRLSSPVFGFHEIFHFFVLGGSLCHYWLMLRYILYLS